jgi:hypothetical protein
VSYYVVNLYDDEKLIKNPPDNPVYEKLFRHIDPTPLTRKFGI